MERRLAAILVADVVGFSRLIGADEEGTLAALKALRQDTIEPLVDRHRGQIIKLMGDGFLVMFYSAVDAVRCAVEWQTQLAGRQPEGALVFRIGVHLGDIVVEDGDILGDGVNISARLEGLSAPGGIAISDAVYQNGRARLVDQFEDDGLHTLKNIEAPVQVWKWAGNTPHSCLTDTSPPLPEKPSIVVLPFANRSGDAEQDFFADGITEDIITELSRFNSLFVIAHNSSLSFKNKVVPIHQIGKELGVAYAVEGSVRKAGNRVRVSAQLIHTKSGKHAWAERYDRELTDIFLIQDEITQSIAGTLAIALEDQTLEQASSKRPEDLRVYEHWTRGKRFLWRAGPQNLEAQHHFEAAISLDPAFAYAHAGLAVTHVMAALDFPTGAEFDACQQRAFESSHHALSLDPNAYQAHVSLAWVFLYQGDYGRLKKHIDLAMQLNPNDSDTLANAAYLLASYGDAEEAAKAGEKAFRLNPRHPNWYVPYYCWALFNARRYQESMNVRMTQPDVFVDGRFCGAATLAYIGEVEEANRWVEIAMRDLKARPIGKELANRDIIELILDNNPCNKQEDRDHYAEGLRMAGVKG